MTLRAWGWVCAAVTAFGGCGYSTTPPDADGDADVDGDVDGDADAGAQADCAAEPEGRGCPCDEPVACWSGPEGTASVGTCQAGLRHCNGGVFGACEGQVLPAEEVCNLEDDDCDGLVDEGVTSVCGDCNPECVADCVGIGCDVEFGEGEGAVERDEDGALTLGASASPQHHLIWVANSAEGTVSKLDTQTREELGRYRTGDTAYPNPSRTTVNLVGDVVVGNRAEGSATKIRARGCEDANGDGLQTSSGGDDVLPWGEEDCVAWKVDGIPAARGSAFEVRRELDGSLHEYVWVSSYDFQNGPLFEIDSLEGEMTGRQVNDMPGYGSSLGPGGKLWLVGLSGCPVSIDTTTLERTDYGCPPNGGGYGITVDRQGRVWIGSAVARLDPETEEWELPSPLVTGGGIAVDLDGNAWVGEYGAAYKVDGETMEATAIPGAGGHGWAVDFDGFVWSVDYVDSAHVVDPDTLEVEDVRPPFVGPYTYSDMTGFQLQSVTPSAGTYRERFEGCGDGTPTTWADLEWIGDVPAETSMTFRIRTADEPSALEVARWVPLGDGSPQSIGDALDRAGVAPGRWLEVEVSLSRGEGVGRPRLESFTVEHSC